MVDEEQKALEEGEALNKLGAGQEALSESSKYTAADVRIMRNTRNALGLKGK